MEGMEEMLQCLSDVDGRLDRWTAGAGAVQTYRAWVLQDSPGLRARSSSFLCCWYRVHVTVHAPKYLDLYVLAMSTIWRRLYLPSYILECAALRR